MSKGSTRRPVCIFPDEEAIRWELAFCMDENRKKELKQALKAIEETKNENVHLRGYRIRSV